MCNEYYCKDCPKRLNYPEECGINKIKQLESQNSEIIEALIDMLTDIPIFYWNDGKFKEYKELIEKIKGDTIDNILKEGA